MAVPVTVNIKNITGMYSLNRSLSDSSQALLKMQGISWLVRQAVAFSNISVTIKQYNDSEGKVHIDMEQVSSGGIRSNEERCLDWEFMEKTDSIFGKIRARTRFAKLSEIEDDYLKQGWEQTTSDAEFVEAFAESVKDTWTALQIWGFAEVDGQRRHVRRILAKKGAEEHRIRMIYDWKN